MNIYRVGIHHDTWDSDADLYVEFFADEKLANEYKWHLIKNFNQGQLEVVTGRRRKCESCFQDVRYDITDTVFMEPIHVRDSVIDNVIE